jgi:DNA-binding NarL/FixJ family response regulator
VILDLAMHLMNGLDAAQEITTIMPNLPMIMFTMLDCTALLKASAEAAGIKTRLLKIGWIR